MATNYPLIVVPPSTPVDIQPSRVGDTFTVRTFNFDWTVGTGCSYLIGEFGCYARCVAHGYNCTHDNDVARWIASLPLTDDGTPLWPSA